MPVLRFMVTVLYYDAHRHAKSITGKSPTMLDTHAHLTSPLFATDLPAVLSRAQFADITSIIVVSESLEDAEKVLSLTASHPHLYPALGLHPSHVTALDPSTLSNHFSTLVSLLDNPSVVAIGEVGLDFTPHVLSLHADAPAARLVQRQTFSQFLSLSQSLALPLTVHSRAAGRHALDLVLESLANGPIQAVMHAFDGRPIYAERALDRAKEGLYFSIPPSIVRSDNMNKLVRRLPLERLLLESDAPALGIERGKRGDPAMIEKAVDMIGALKGMSVTDVKSVIAENERRMFPKVFQKG